jgi:hypothetical protein
MVKYEGKIIKRILPILESDDKKIILITHNEIFISTYKYNIHKYLIINL